MVVMSGIVWPSQGYPLYRNAQWCEGSCRRETSPRAPILERLARTDRRRRLQP
jgi:hypothetical protein